MAERIELAERIEAADLVITGEGLIDEQSLQGKTVGGVAALAAELGKPVVVIAGDLEGDPLELPFRTLVEAFGVDAAWADPLGCLAALTAQVLEEAGV